MTEYTPAEAREAVERGAAWLDERCPDWIREIDLEQLDLQSTRVCILGQTATCLVGNQRMGEPGFWRVRRSLSLNDDEWIEEHGFDVPAAEDFNEYDDDGHQEYGTRYEVLTLTWRELIRERLETAA